jgi:hypothetical protein
MTDVIEVSYTGDLLAHRRCPRAWAYEKHVGLHPYEQVQAMEGHLIHHAMEWLTKEFRQNGIHASREELERQLHQYYRVLWGRGIKTAFRSREDVVSGVGEDLYPNGNPLPEVRAVVEGAVHEEYPLRSVRKVVPELFGGKSRILLTGVLDVVVQQKGGLSYGRAWEWTNVAQLEGRSAEGHEIAEPGELEIWDYKGTRADTTYLQDYVRQVVTYAALLEDRLGLPARCVLFFVKESDPDRRLLSVPVTREVIDASVAWTIEQVREVRQTVLQMQQDPLAIEGGDIRHRTDPTVERVPEDLKKQCTACGQRFDCQSYAVSLDRRRRRQGVHPDLDIRNIHKN